MHAETVGDENGANHQQESERQYDHGRVLVDEVGEGIGREQHHRHGGHHGDDHDRKMLRHTDRRKDRVDREHKVQEQDLGNGSTKSERRLGPRAIKRSWPSKVSSQSRVSLSEAPSDCSSSVWGSANRFIGDRTQSVTTVTTESITATS